jgi:ABC-type lipoprotein export system ATPase subunit
VVMVTHSQHDAQFAQRIVRLLDGKVLSEHAPSALRTSDTSTAGAVAP